MAYIVLTYAVLVYTVVAYVVMAPFPAHTPRAAARHGSQGRFQGKASYGLYSYGLYNYGLYSYGLHIVMA